MAKVKNTATGTEIDVDDARAEDLLNRGGYERVEDTEEPKARLKKSEAKSEDNK